MFATPLKAVPNATPDEPLRRKLFLGLKLWPKLRVDLGLGRSVLSLLEVVGRAYSIACLGPDFGKPQHPPADAEDLGGRDPSW